MTEKGIEFTVVFVFVVVWLVMLLSKYVEIRARRF